MGVARHPYRPSNRPIPTLRTPSDRRKVAFYELGTEFNRKTRKFSAYVDIINGNSDLVDYVGFRFAKTGETHNIYKRKPVQLSDGNTVPRFLIKEHEVNKWCRDMTVVVFGKGGSRRVRHLKARRGKLFRERPLKFLETRGLRWNYLMAPNLNFGVEIETSLSGFTTSRDVVLGIEEATGITVVDKTDRYLRGTEDYSQWQLVPDASTECSLSDPDCNKFELVSRILTGEDGLNECQTVLRALKTVGRARCNQSMGLHVHVSVDGLSIERLKNICLNFIKHEEVMDSLMPASRRTSKYCRSNKASVPGHTDGEKHSAIASCNNLPDLCRLMNSDRYFKLNLQNLVSDHDNSNKKKSKPTVEFRQHSSTTNFEKIEAWVRFCTNLVRNSTERPQKLKHYEDAFDSLFDTVIQDLKLKEFYRERRRLHREDDGGGGCAGGSAAPCDHCLNGTEGVCKGH